jgi:hypothetical protein
VVQEKILFIGEKHSLGDVYAHMEIPMQIERHYVFNIKELEVMGVHKNTSKD